MSRIDLSIGGWDGWFYGPWGRAKIWRIHAPTGETFLPSEIIGCIGKDREISYLKSQIKKLRAMQFPITQDDFLQVEAAYTVIKGLLTMYSPDLTNTTFERRINRALSLARNYHAGPTV